MIFKSIIKGLFLYLMFPVNLIIHYVALVDSGRPLSHQNRGENMCFWCKKALKREVLVYCFIVEGLLESRKNPCRWSAR